MSELLRRVSEMDGQSGQADHRCLWAKLDADGTHVWHPLVCHLIDTASVAQAMWSGALTASILSFIGRATGLAPGDARNWLCFWTALHDLGKASPAFQCQSHEQQLRLEAAGYVFDSAIPHVLHGLVSYVALQDLLHDPPCPLAPLDRGAAQAIAYALGGHHGQFPDAAMALREGPRAMGGPAWHRARCSLFADLAAVCGLDSSSPCPTPSADDHPFFMFLAGYTSVCDWIASAREHFPYADGVVDMPAYVRLSRERADRALRALGWTGWQPPDSTCSFSDLFPGWKPRAMQRATVDAAQGLSEPALVLIEAPMGEGKTESALYLLDRWNVTLGQRGGYLALPTQATANAMFTRFVGGYLQRRYAGRATEVHLLHGQACLSDDYQQLQSVAQVYDDAANSPQEALVAHEWFTHHKRGLLGPFAIGTIDQALLAAMQTRHVFVRLFGLAGKTIILDEVHAFDTYTSTLIDRLLQWLAALDCSVVLLSATLPAARRQRLLEAYAGRNLDVPAAPYPRVTVVSRWKVRTSTFDCAHREVALEWVTRDAGRLAWKLREELAPGGCAAVVCNTVSRAQEVFLALREVLADASIEVDLFHARYPFAERDRREKRALRLFGKSSHERPVRSVLVATQVIEQSLDLDFDLLVTELAPIDLILQRSGRMHRHERACRPPRLARPRLWLMEPDTGSDGQPAFGNDRFVYGEYLLLRTWLVLREYPSIRVPEDVEELIESVYGDAPVPAVAGLTDRLTAARREADRRRDTLEAEAKDRLLRSPSFGDGFLFFASADTLDEDNPTMHRAFRALTRFSDRPSIAIACLRSRANALFVQTDDGPVPVDLASAPNATLTAQLLEGAVSLSGAVAGYFIGSVETPVGWRRNALLRYMRAAVFDEEGVMEAETFALRLDGDLGIVIDRRTDEGDSE